MKMILSLCAGCVSTLCLAAEYPLLNLADQPVAAYGKYAQASATVEKIPGSPTPVVAFSWKDVTARNAYFGWNARGKNNTIGQCPRFRIILNFYTIKDKIPEIETALFHFQDKKGEIFQVRYPRPFRKNTDERQSLETIFDPAQKLWSWAEGNTPADQKVDWPIRFLGGAFEFSKANAAAGKFYVASIQFEEMEEDF